MRFNFYILLEILSLFTGTSMAGVKNIYGLNEHVYIREIDMIINNKLNRSAKTACLSARDIEHFKRDGEQWVRFYLALDEAHEHALELPLARISRIKRRSGDYDPEEDKSYTPRPVVKMSVCMGRSLETIE